MNKENKEIIRKAFKSSGLKQAKFANSLKVTPGHISSILSGDGTASDSLAQLASIKYLNTKTNNSSEKYIGIPVSEGEISAEPGLEADHRFNFKIQFRKDWLEKKGDPSNMSMIRVSGNSMEPTIQHGDIALINHAVNHIDTPGAIYAITINDQVSLKRLQFISEREKIKIISDNKDYDVDYVNPKDMFINGKALWIGREELR